MSLDKQKKTIREEEFNLDSENDRRVIHEFEREIAPYSGREFKFMPGTKFEKTLRGFELYLHEHGLYRYSSRYPLGAVGDHETYSFVLAKKKALDKLMDRRKEAEKKEREGLESNL